MSSFLMFVMVCALFVHTFINFLTGVYAAVVNKLSATPVASAVSSVETFVGGVVAAVVGFFKKLL
jgi:uncharacterized protein YqhQ